MTRATLAVLAAALLPALADAQETPKPPRQPSVEIFGFAQVDYIQDFKRVNPDWDAMLRPTKIPTTKGEFGSDGQAIFSARQSRLGVKGTFPSGAYDLKARIEFDFFGRSGGASPDAAGQSTIRLRRAYGEWGPILGGLTDSLFMDDDFWPNIVEYWGPSGMVFFRNVQIRYTFPLKGASSFAIAIERPGADVQGYPEELPYTIADNKLPDLTGRYRVKGSWGYLQLSGILRRLGYTTAGTPNNEPKGHVVGWGVNASSTLRILPGRLSLLLSAVTGEGIENYMNDATPDLAAGGTAASPKAEAVPLWGMAAYADIAWSELLSSAVGYSMVTLDNRSLQRGSDFSMGQYASVNVLVHPAENFLLGPELQWAERTDNDGAKGDDIRLQLSLKYAFSVTKDFWK